MAGAEPPEQPLVFLALVEVIAVIGIGLAILGIGRLAPSLASGTARDTRRMWRTPATTMDPNEHTPNSSARVAAGMADAAPASAPAATLAQARPDVTELTFDAALAEFQDVVSALEHGGQPLEEAIELYERGVALNARLERLLNDAELRIRHLVERAGGQIDARDVRPDEPIEEA